MENVQVSWNVYEGATAVLYIIFHAEVDRERERERKSESWYMKAREKRERERLPNNDEWKRKYCVRPVRIRVIEASGRWGRAWIKYGYRPCPE